MSRDLAAIADALRLPCAIEYARHLWREHNPHGEVAKLESRTCGDDVHAVMKLALGGYSAWIGFSAHVLADPDFGGEDYVQGKVQQALGDVAPLVARDWVPTDVARLLATLDAVRAERDAHASSIAQWHDEAVRVARPVTGMQAGSPELPSAFVRRFERESGQWLGGGLAYYLEQGREAGEERTRLARELTEERNRREVAEARLRALGVEP